VRRVSRFREQHLHVEAVVALAEVPTWEESACKLNAILMEVASEKP